MSDIVTVTTQKELDAALKAGAREIRIDAPSHREIVVRDSGSSTVRAYGSSTVRAAGSSTVWADGSSTVWAYGSSTVWADGSSTVWADGSSTVRAYGSSTVWAYGSSTVWAYGSSTVWAAGSSTVWAYGSSTVWADGSSTVRADGSSTVRADGSSTVRAYGSSTVRAAGSSTVWADGSSTVWAYGSSTVWAYGSSTVWAAGSSTVWAYGSSTVRAGKLVPVQKHSKHTTIEGGVLIDHTAIDLANVDTWCEYHGAERDGTTVTLYKATGDEFEAGEGYTRTLYVPGTEVVAADFRADGRCGGGLHLSPNAGAARAYRSGAKRFLRCEVDVADVSVIVGLPEAPKVKVRACWVIEEVDVHHRPVVRS